MDEICIRVLNWEKFNPRKDIKNPSWFALHNRILEDPKLFGLSAIEFKALIYILCQASQNGPEVTLYFDHAEQVCRINPSDLNSSIEKLVKKGVVEIDVKSERVRTDPNVDERARTQTSRDTTLQDTTLQDTTEQNTTILAQPTPAVRPRSVDHDFAKFWDRYPRKQGKSKALKAYSREIKAGAIPEQLLASLERYRAHCEASKTEAQFIKHGPTFVAEWRDWLDPETGQTEDFSKGQALDWKYIFGEEKAEV